MLTQHFFGRKLESSHMTSLHMLSACISYFCNFLVVLERTKQGLSENVYMLGGFMCASGVNSTCKTEGPSVRATIRLKTANCTVLP